MMDERSFYTEQLETKTHALVCPHCHVQENYPVRWMVRTKKTALPRGATDEDRKRFANARSYMVRVDEVVTCFRCRKRFELTGQTVILVSPAPAGSVPADPDSIGNR